MSSKKKKVKRSIPLPKKFGKAVAKLNSLGGKLGEAVANVELYSGFDTVVLKNFEKRIAKMHTAFAKFQEQYDKVQGLAYTITQVGRTAE